MSEEVCVHTKVKKAAIVILINLKREATSKGSSELEAEIRQALEEALVKIPGLVVKDIIVVEE